MNRANLMRRRPERLDEEAEADLRNDLRECANYEDMFASEGWQQVVALLEGREEQAVRVLEQGTPDQTFEEVKAARAHLRLIRELLALPDATTERRRKATEALHPEGEET